MPRIALIALTVALSAGAAQAASSLPFAPSTDGASSAEPVRACYKNGRLVPCPPPARPTP
jgi:hypothetical protein